MHRQRYRRREREKRLANFERQMQSTLEAAERREQEAIHRVQLTGSYMFTRYEHVHALARDRRLGAEIAHALPNPAIDAERAMLAAANTTTESILRIDGDDHSRVRRLMQKPFTPKRIAEWRRRAVEVSDQLLDQLADDGGGDLIADYAEPLPVEIILMMGGAFLCFEGAEKVHHKFFAHGLLPQVR